MGIVHEGAYALKTWPLDPLEIPLELRSRLAAEQIVSLRQWARLSSGRKRAIFGVTAKHRAQLDALARGATVNAIVLADLAAQINSAHAAALEHARSAVQRARKAGELLLQAQKQLPHGAWLPWLQTNCPDLSERTAQAYMRVARSCLENPERAAELESLTLRDALQRLAAPRLPGPEKSAAVADLERPASLRLSLQHTQQDLLSARFDALVAEHEGEGPMNGWDAAAWQRWRARADALDEIICERVRVEHEITTDFLAEFGYDRRQIQKWHEVFIEHYCGARKWDSDGWNEAADVAFMALPDRAAAA